MSKASTIATPLGGRHVGKLLKKDANLACTRSGASGTWQPDDWTRERRRGRWRARAARFGSDPPLPAARRLDEGDRLRAAESEDGAPARWRKEVELVPGSLSAIEPCSIVTVRIDEAQAEERPGCLQPSPGQG
jgi:hypothetical protein